MKTKDLGRLPLFKGFDPAQMELMRSLFIECLDKEGSVLFKQGSHAENLYVILDGEVSVRYKPDDGPELSVTKVGADGVVGWSAVLGSHIYTSSAVCLTDCKLLRVNSNALHGLMMEHPGTGKIIIERLGEVIAERLRNTHHHVISLLNQGMSIRLDESVSTD